VARAKAERKIARIRAELQMFESAVEAKLAAKREKAAQKLRKREAELPAGDVAASVGPAAERSAPSRKAAVSSCSVSGRPKSCTA